MRKRVAEQHHTTGLRLRSNRSGVRGGTSRKGTHDQGHEHGNSNGSPSDGTHALYSAGLVEQRRFLDRDIRHKVALFTLP
jgi:hypothetical protein